MKDCNKSIVTVGIIINKHTDVIYSLNSVLAQDYSSMEIIISVNQSSGILVTNIFDCIESHKGKNIASIKINYTKKSFSEYEHMDYICKNAVGEYICFLLNDDAFYEVSSLSYLMDTFKQCDVGNIVFGKSVCYSTDDVYQYVYPEIDLKKVKSINFESPIMICGTKKYFTDNFMKENFTLIQYLSVLFNRILNKQEKIFFAPEGIVRHYIRNDVCEKMDVSQLYIKERYLNYADGLFLRELIKKLMELEKNKQYYVDAINQKMELLWGKSADGYWGVSRSAGTLLVFLEEIKKCMSDDLPIIIGVKYLLMLLQIEKIRAKKIKVVLAVNEPTLWITCFKSLYIKLLEDERFIVDVVYIPFLHRDKDNDVVSKEYNEYRKMDINIYKFSEYNLAVESPDIIVYSKPYNAIPCEWYVGMVEKVVERIIYIPYGMIPNQTGDEYVRLFYQLPMNLVAWKYLSYNRIHTEMMKKHSINYANCLPIGHPKYDIDMNLLSYEDREQVKQIVSLSAGRKTVMWNTHFGIDLSEKIGRGTFCLLGNDLLEYFKNNRDSFFLVWRPHPLFYNALQKKYTEEEIKRFWREIEEIDNIYIDKYTNQMPAVFSSDILISDESSIIETYVVTGKPIILTVRDKTSIINCEGYQILYTTDNIEEVVFYLAVLENGNDEKADARKKYIKENYYLPDSHESVAERLISNIITEIIMEEKSI